jgi:hypothetical protein
MHGINPSIQHAGGIDRPGNRPQSVPTVESTTTTGSTAVTDEVTLSPEAKEFIANSGPGKSGHSPAHQARAMIAGNPELAGMSFGQIVSGINHGVDFSAVPEGESDEVPVDGTETALVVPTAPVPDSTASTIEELTSPLDPVPTEDPLVPVADGTDAVVVVAPPADGTDATVPTTEAAIVASTGLGDLDMFPDVKPLVEVDDGKSLLEELTEAIDEANGEDPDTVEGINIAA